MTDDPWDVAWGDGVLEVQTRPADGYLLRRVVSVRPHAGAVVLAQDPDDRLVLIEVDRPIVGRRLLELPRGTSDPGDADPVATGLRELAEETGLRAGRAVALGTVWPDSGLLGDAIEVVLVHDVRPDPAVAAEHHDLTWLTAEQVDAAILDGRLRDGISLAALALLRASRAGRPGRG